MIRDVRRMRRIRPGERGVEAGTCREGADQKWRAGRSRRMMEKGDVIHMKRGKKLAVAFLCACMAVVALTGCSDSDVSRDSGTDEQNDAFDSEAGVGNAGGEPSENAKGRFLETEVELPEKIASVIGVRKCDDGSIVLVGYDENRVGLYMERSENQGQDWEEIPLDSGDYRIAAINPADGSAALIGYFPSNEEADIRLAAADGSMKTLRLCMPAYERDGEDATNIIFSAGYAAGKLFAVDFNYKIYEVDTESGGMKEALQVSAEGVTNVIPLGEHLALLTRNGVRLADAKEGVLLAEDEELETALGVVSNESDSPVYRVMLTEGGDRNELYYISHGGIFYHRQGGSTTEQLANGELMSVGDESMGFRGLVYLDDEHFLAFVQDSLGNERCYSYAYDAEASVVPEKQLTIYALEDSTILQQAIGAFRKQNQDVFVRKMIGMSGDDGVTAEDAIRKLNTEIMAGNGPDVLVLDGLPVDSYIEKGILSEIGSLVDEVEQADGLFTNITDAFRKDGAAYQAPLRFYFAAVEKNAGIGELSGAPEKLAAYAQSLKGDVPVLGAMPAETLLYAFYDAYSSSWKTQDGIDAESLKRSLSAAKTLYDIDGYVQEDRWNNARYGIYQGQTIYGTIEMGCYNRVENKAQMSIGTVPDVTSVRTLYGIESVKEGSLELLCGEGQESFIPLVNLGLAQTAKDRELAQDFIRTVLSAEGQTLMTAGFSVNKTAYEKTCDSKKEFSIGTSDVDGNLISYEVKALTEEQKQALTAMLERLKAPIWNDRVVMDLVISEGTKYLQGEQSLEDAAGAITQKVRLYVSE